MFSNILVLICRRTKGKIMDLFLLIGNYVMILLWPMNQNVFFTPAIDSIYKK